MITPASMRILHGTALESWQRYKALGLRLQQTMDAEERARLERDLQDAVQQFRRTYAEQQVRLRAV